METEIKNIAEDYFSRSDYKIIDYILRGEKGTKVLEIYVDNRKGINIDELVKINHELDDLIEEKIASADISKLQVSSPGAERSFKFIWQLEKHIGRDIEAILSGDEDVTGKLTMVSENDGKIGIEIQKKEKGKKNTEEYREINFGDILESKIKLKFK
ncbi:MAG TPA: ribosome assembly cofactor RimP [Ignavibacteria bacterium]|nr:ribosome assembly cofactor RimP [Bacteroidota bacterium]HRI84476.1 ribosome assembly cofactor RimP [Ignavibacteria bacterium]HRJ98858.1 ribosome assembly cofactor RimP [Ignavibacteria bacterium]